VKEDWASEESGASEEAVRAAHICASEGSGALYLPSQ
jgi:hypothetical protein